MPQWCLTPPCVPPPEDNTRLFEVGAEFCAEDADDVGARLRAVADVRVVEDVLRVASVDVADSAVEPVDDFDRDAGVVEDPDPPVKPPFGVALAELRTRC